MIDRPAVIRRIGLGLGLAIAALAFLVLTRSTEQYGDSLKYLESARSGIDLYHSHHLGYNSSIRVFHLGLTVMGARTDIITSAQIFNILWALVALFGLFVLARRLTGSNGWAVAAAAALLVCQGFWEYASQAQTYVPAMGVLALTACLAMGRPDRPWTPLRAAALAGLFVLAILFHQTAVLFLFPLIVLFALSADSVSRRRLMGAGFLAALLILGLYAAAFLTSGNSSSVSGFLRYALDYTFHPAPNWGTWRNVSPNGLGYLLFSLLRNIVTVFRSIRGAVLVGFGLFLAGLFVWHLLHLRNRRDATRPGRAFLLAWLTVHCGFYLWWAPHDKNNFIMALFPLVLLTVLAGHDLATKLPRAGRRPAAAIAGVLILGLGAVNYVTFIRPLHLSPGFDFAEAARLNACIPKGDFILSSNEVQANLVFHFRRSGLLQVEIPPMCFGQGIDLPEAYGDLALRPFVLSPAFLDPGSRLSIVTGYDHAEGWRRWLVWLFSLELDARGEVVSGRSFETLDCGGLYLRVRMERSPWSGWGGFLERLDATLAPAFGGRTRVFRDWAESTGVLKAPAGAPRR
jgi:hypothetical protein